MQKLTALFFALSVVTVAYADDWTDPVTGLRWTFVPSANGGAAIGDGLTAAISTDTAGELTLPSEINGLPVTGIGHNSFAGCDKLTAVAIPASVVSVESDSFSGCVSLRKVTIPDRFANWKASCCSAPVPPLYRVAFAHLPITDVIIAGGVASIDGAFANCATLRHVTIPSSVKAIARGSFAGCTGLGHGVVVVSGWAVRIDDEIARGDVEFPEGTRGIEDYAYGSDLWDTAPLIRSVRMPAGLEFIGAGAFHCCSNISSVVFSPDVKEIGYGAFTGCQGLTSVDLPSGLQTVGDSAFWCCGNLAAVTIPSSVSRIGGGAFGGTKLVDEYEDGLVVIDGCLVEIKGNRLKTVDIPEGVRLLANGIFSWEDPLETITIPKSLTELGEEAFFGCSALKAFVVDEENPNYKSVDGLLLTKDGKVLLRGVNGDVTIPEGVTTIGEGAFSAFCPMTVTVPASVTSVGMYAFEGSGTGENTFMFKGLPPIGLEDCWLDGVVRYDQAYAAEWEELAEYVGMVALPFGVPLPDGGPYREFADGISWRFMVANGEARVGGDASWGDVAAIPQETAGAITVPAVLGECPVTCIENEAFAGCSNLTEVVIPNSVTDIGVVSWNVWNLGCDADGGFYYEDRTYGVEGEYPNYHWTAEAAERLPHLAWEVAYYPAAYSYPRLVISSPSECLTQEEIAYLNGLTSKYCFRSGGRWCTSIRVRGSNAAFAGCDKIRSVALPSVGSLAGIFPDAYDKVTNVVITQCRWGYGTLSDMSQPTEGKSVGGLDGCRNLVKVILPEDTEIIEAFAFQDCSSLKSIDLPSGVKVIDEYAFSGCSSLRHVTLPSRHALRDVFPDSYDKIQAVVLSDGSSTLGASMLRGCEALESVVIPASVTSVDSGAFAKLSKLTSATFLGDAPDFGEDVFYGTPRRMTLTVPEDSLGWTDYELLGLPPPWGMRSVVGSSGGESGGGGTGEPDPGAAVPVSVVVVSNVVVHYVMNSVMSLMAAPVTEDVGIVNVMTEIKGGNVAIPDSWADNYPTFAQKFGAEFAAALTKPSGKTDAAGNPMLVWQDYVAGTDPTDRDDVFRASVTIVDGKPVVSYTPELTAAEKARRVYRTFGKVRLGDDGWALVPEGREADYNFFKVTVEMK